jgi:hypothetical protein
MANRTAHPDEVERLLKLGAALSVQSIDLRAQYEANLRILTDIQREIERLRSPKASIAEHQAALQQPYTVPRLMCAGGT